MKTVEEILRTLPTTEKIFRSSRRVRSIKAIDCIAVLSKHGYDAEAIKREMQKLLTTYKLVKVKVSQRNPHSVDLLVGKTVSPSDVYVWSEDESSGMSFLIMGLVVALITVLVMFRLWPAWLKRAASYSRYPLIAFILFLLVMGVVRLIVFSITYFSHPPGLWIFPNLFADCGFFDSFIPVYSWGNQKVAHKKKCA